MASIVASAEFVASDGSRSIYRVDLSQLPLNSVLSVTLIDDGIKSGGSGGASGLDLDFIVVSPKSYTSENFKDIHRDLQQSNHLNADVVFNPGYLTQWQDGDLGTWNVSHLFGTAPGNYYDYGKSTLSLNDGDYDGSVGTLSLGEGGQISVLFNEPVTTGTNGSTKHYLYFADFGGSSQYTDELKIILADDRSVVPYPSGLTLRGDERSETIALGQGINMHNGAGADVVFGVGGHDKIFTAGGHDWVYGGEGNDRLYGQAGRDRIYGENGNDWLFGGTDNDFLRGGNGYDTFVFDSRLGNWKTDRTVNFDRIDDFNVKFDSIYLDNKIFTKLGKKGSELNPAKMKAAFFQIGQADDRDDYILYNKKTGILSYDTDGHGSRKAVEFAKLDKNLKLTYKDFFIV